MHSQRRNSYPHLIQAFISILGPLSVIIIIIIIILLFPSTKVALPHFQALEPPLEHLAVYREHLVTYNHVTLAIAGWAVSCFVSVKLRHLIESPQGSFLRTAEPPTVK